MIRIDTTKIEKWDEIKEKHLKAVKLIVKEKIEKFKKEQDIYILEQEKTNKAGKKEIITVCKMKEKYKAFLEKLLGLKIIDRDSYLKVEFKNDKEIEIFAIGKIDDSLELFEKIEKQSRINKSELNKILKIIFDYDKFAYSKKDWSRHRLISDLNIRSCPYCNRQYITNYEFDKTTADLDHFYPKADYPFLALSLYNFIPSCQICNSRFKLKENFKEKAHIYPYKEAFDSNAVFRTKPSVDFNIDYLQGLSLDFEIELKLNEEMETKLKNRIENSIKTFKLNEVYQSHKDYVSEMIRKSIVYNESRINELLDQYPGLFKDRDDVLQMIVSNYICDDELDKRPLAKLTKDICEEFGLFN